MNRWFLPETPDVMARLTEQADRTVLGMEAFAAWSRGDADAAVAVRDCEHAADEARRGLQHELRTAFSTPLDPQDIYELSERLDRVINGAKNAVREAELMKLPPNEPTAAIADDLLEGARHLRDAFGALVTDADAATDAADAAIRCERRIEHRYRAAMSELLQVDDVREVIEWREMYRRYARIANHLVETAERVWYTAVK